MSGLEKLKTLVEEHDGATVGALALLGLPLPQIVAVVEAMHKTVYAEVNGAVDESGRIWTRTEIQMVAIDDGQAALAALEEALS